MRKIAVLTYPVKHRKTFDLLSLLKANGYNDVRVCAIPFHYQKKRFPMIQHRPEMHYEIPETSVLSANLGYEYILGQLEDFSIEPERIVLVAGAGILPDDFVKTHTIINAHPGYIPNCRGLDAFKWAIIDDEPIGVTTHLIGNYVDAGLVIERRSIVVFETDTFHAVAQRVYENEVSMLVEAIEKYDGDLEEIIPGDHIVHKRMPEEIEKQLFDAFDIYKSRHAVKRED